MNKVKVMIVEDDHMVSFLHKALLVKRNISSEPEAFMNGMEAFDYMMAEQERSEDNFYLILLDINMPLMNGWEFLEALKEQEIAERTSVIIVTSSPDRKDRELAKKYDQLISAYLEKPLIDFAPIRECLEALKSRSI